MSSFVWLILTLLITQKRKHGKFQMFLSGPVRFNTVKISQNLPYSLTENDQYKHLPNVSEMITVIILALTRQMSILNGVAHQLLWGMDVMIQQYKIFLWTAVVQRDSSMRVKKKKRDQSRVQAEIAKFFIACKQKQNRKKPVSQFENHSLKVSP